jgi:diguanylate cyclase (GGDEF)-like protein
VANIVGLPLFGILSAGWSPLRAVDDTAAVVVFAVLAAWRGASRKLRSICASLGLLAAAALAVDAAGGRIEAHFTFFVLIIVLTLYEDWTPFLMAVGFVLIHHGVYGTLDPKAVFDRPEEWAQPWLWAGIHAAFVAAAGVAGVLAWRLNEDVRAKMRSAHARMEELSETDALTGLGNRRKLMTGLTDALELGERAVLILFDLDGFKAYNDEFGHPAGDALLIRLAHKLQTLSEGRGRAYRLGGDEFCVIWAGDGRTSDRLEQIAADALSERGEGFAISASHGAAILLDEVTSADEALRTADHRMYSNKRGGRTSTLTQTRNVLLRSLAERIPSLGTHGDTVTALSDQVARRLGLPEDEIEHVRCAAELHDIGKIAIPDAVIDKPGPLSDEEWDFMRQHTLIGERILTSAPALAAVAPLVRASHERFDGRGYPDGLAGEQIPLGARIVFACDAYDAMTSDRPYSEAMHPTLALAELRHCSGTQFDPVVVAALTDIVRERPAAPLAELTVAA